MLPIRFINILLLLLLCYPIMAQTNSNLEEWRRSVVVMNLAQINSEKDDYAPAFYRSGIVYPSSRKKNGPIDKVTGDTYHDLYFAPLLSDGVRAKASSFSLILNSPFHEGPVTFDRDYQTIYFSRSSDKQRNKVHVKIYEATKGASEWENVKELPFNNDGFSCMHPTLSPAGDRLFFASDMPGGFGETDIYMVEKINNQWSRPINLGPEVNTKGKEAFPFIHDSGVLFFASTGHPGYGNYDIFMINLADPNEEIINLGSPFNSPNDDFGFILDPMSESGYFTSNRPGGIGGDDIYSFRALNGLKNMSNTFSLRSTVQIINELSNAPVPLADVRIFEKEGNQYSEDIYNYIYVQDMQQPSRKMLQKVLKDEKEIQQIPVRTDRRGELIQNFKSEKEYLILISKSGFTTKEYVYSTKGKIAPERLVIPIEPITCFDLSGMVYSPSQQRIPYAEVRLRNECTGREEALTTNHIGEFVFCLEQGCDFSVKASASGFSPYLSEISTKGIRGTRSMNMEIMLQPQRTNIMNMPIETGSTAILENIYYDLASYDIKPEAAKELDQLFVLMNKYPSIKIELIAHTDSRGDAFSNMELSQKRAQAAQQYLINKGIAHHRIKTYGFGESRIRNHCVDGVNCTEAEHEFNRRTEVKIIEVSPQDKLRIDNNR